LLPMRGGSWQELGKIHWNLGQTEETLAAYRNALEVQQKLFFLHSGAPEMRKELGVRYDRLGRKLCELGRLDEAEAYFCAQQALWPRDAAKHAQVLQDL